MRLCLRLRSLQRLRRMLAIRRLLRRLRVV